MPERKTSALERLSALYEGDRERALKDQLAGQKRAAAWFPLRLHPNHPDYQAWKHALVNNLPWPPEEVQP